MGARLHGARASLTSVQGDIAALSRASSLHEASYQAQQRALAGVDVVSEGTVEAIRLRKPTADAVLGLTLRATSDRTPADLRRGFGVSVTHVRTGGLSHRSGLRTGDILLSIDGSPVDDPDEFADLLRTAPAGVTVALEVLRPPEMPPVAAPPAPVYEPPPPVAVARGSVTAPARGSVAVRRKTAAAATGDRVAAHLEAAADAAAERRAAAAAAAHAVTQAATQRLAHLTGRRGKSSGAPAAYVPPSPDKFGPLTQLGRAAAHGAVNPKTAQRALAGARASVGFDDEGVLLQLVLRKPTAEAVLGVTLLESPDGLGCRVNSLTRGGAAMMSGLQVGDIILAVNGEASSGEPDVLATALRRASGNVGLDVIRVYASMSV